MVQEADVRTARRKLGLSQEKLAEKLGVTRNTISRWELGDVSPSAENLIALDRLLTQIEDPAVPKAEPAPPPDTPVPSPDILAPVKAKRWPVVLVCIGLVCALLVGIAALIGVYSIKQQLEPTDSAAPIEEAEIAREEVDDLQIEFVTRQPLQP